MSVQAAGHRMVSGQPCQLGKMRCGYPLKNDHGRTEPWRMSWLSVPARSV